jgi:hypothetical protein
VIETESLPGAERAAMFRLVHGPILACEKEEVEFYRVVEVAVKG